MGAFHGIRWTRPLCERFVALSLFQRNLPPQQDAVGDRPAAFGAAVGILPKIVPAVGAQAAVDSCGALPRSVTTVLLQQNDRPDHGPKGGADEPRPTMSWRTDREPGFGGCQGKAQERGQKTGRHTAIFHKIS